jgi:hypothetical protein
MFDLATIHRLNEQAATQRPFETETTRHCSICRSHAGVVLHSAKQRSTVFLSGSPAKRFLAKWKACRALSSRDHLVESFF